MGNHIYFDCVQEFKKYGENNELEKQIHKDIAGLNSEEKLNYCIQKCRYFIQEHDDFKTCLGIIFNYCPHKYHPHGDYEVTAVYITMNAKGFISDKELMKRFGF